MHVAHIRQIRDLVWSTGWAINQPGDLEPDPLLSQGPCSLIYIKKLRRMPTQLRLLRLTALLRVTVKMKQKKSLSYTVFLKIKKAKVDFLERSEEAPRLLDSWGSQEELEETPRTTHILLKLN